MFQRPLAEKAIKQAQERNSNFGWLALSEGWYASCSDGVLFINETPDFNDYSLCATSEELDYFLSEAELKSLLKIIKP